LESVQAMTWGVMDGHGFHGGQAAMVARDTIGTALLQLRCGAPSAATHATVTQTLVDAFAAAQQRILELAEGVSEQEREFGTTAAVAALTAADELACAWLGDSRLLLCRLQQQPEMPVTPPPPPAATRSPRRRSLRGSVDGRAAVVFVSQPHSLYDEHECARVALAGGKIVDKSPTVRRVIPADLALEEVHSKRVALNMSRSLGHVALSRCGVSSIPSLSPALPLCSGDRLVIASDGLVPEISNERAAEIVCAASTPRLAAQALLREAQQVNEHSRRHSDNISILVVFFTHDHPPPAALSDSPLPPPPSSPVPPEIEAFSQ